jgi:hypothetical protein
MQTDLSSILSIMPRDCCSLFITPIGPAIDSELHQQTPQTLEILLNCYPHGEISGDFNFISYTLQSCINEHCFKLFWKLFQCMKRNDPAACTSTQLHPHHWIQPKLKLYSTIFV